MPCHDAAHPHHTHALTKRPVLTPPTHQTQHMQTEAKMFKFRGAVGTGAIRSPPSAPLSVRGVGPAAMPPRNVVDLQEPAAAPRVSIPRPEA